jgi:hypothetical protein
MPTTLVYEAQKAAIEERLRQAQFRHQPPRSSRPQPHSTATSRPARRRPPRAMVGLLGLAGAIAVSLLAFASSALAALPSNCRQTQHRGDVRVRVHGPRAGVHGAKRGRQRAGRCPRRGRRRRRSDHAGRHGGVAGAPISVSPGEVLYIEVGGVGNRPGSAKAQVPARPK